jgi:HlyD family secretion protein
MHRRRNSSAPRSMAPMIAIALATATIGGLAWGWARFAARKAPSQQYAVTDVRRADLYPMIKASGRVESGKRTIIECQLERIAVGVRGQGVAAGGASVLLKVIPEGTSVKRGDILAEMDSADYVELLRLQEMSVERARADKLQAELDHEIAKLALIEFRDGTMKEMIEDFQRRVTLARSDLERAQDRLNWTHSMKAKGYVSTSTVNTDEYNVAQLALALKQEEGAFDVFRKYTAPRTIREFEGDIIGAGATLDYQKLRLQRHLDRHATLKAQVEHCTIRAPHDGYVIYANDPRREIFIEEGIPVYQNQKLFYLPDLSDMEVVALLSESDVNQVRDGMRAVVQVEGIPNRSVYGRVTKVGQLPLPDWRNDVHYFEGIVKLEDPPSSLKPGMTAQVELEMPGRENVLAVRSEAVTLDDGQDVCFVVHEDGLERREVKLGQVTREMTEVTQGLREGEQVVLNPHPLDIDLMETPQPSPLPSSEISAGTSTPAADLAASR